MDRDRGERITKEQFEDYECIRESGVTNMFDIEMVLKLSQGLTRNQIFDIQKNYTQLKKQYEKTNI